MKEICLHIDAKERAANSVAKALSWRLEPLRPNSQKKKKTKKEHIGSILVSNCSYVSFEDKAIVQKIQSLAALSKVRAGKISSRILYWTFEYYMRPEMQNKYAELIVMRDNGDITGFDNIVNVNIDDELNDRDEFLAEVSRHLKDNDHLSEEVRRVFKELAHPRFMELAIGQETIIAQMRAEFEELSGSVNEVGERTKRLESDMGDVKKELKKTQNQMDENLKEVRGMFDQIFDKLNNG